MKIHTTPFLVVFLFLIFIVALSSTVSIAQSGATGFSSARLSTGGKELIVYETEPTNPFNDLKVFQKGAKVKMIANNLVCKEFNDILYYMNIEGALYGDVYTAFSGISISKGSCSSIRTNNKADAVYNFMSEGCIAKRNAFLNSPSSKIRTCDTTENRPFNVQAEANLPEVEGTYCIAAGCEVAFRVYDGTAEFRQVEMTVQIKDLGNISQLEKASAQMNGAACGKGTKCPQYKNNCIWNNPSGPGLCSSEQITTTTSTTMPAITTTTLTQTKEAHKSWQAHSSGSVVHKINWSPDGKKIASTDTSEIKIWEASGSLINSFAGGSRGLSWSPDGKKIASILSLSESGGIYPSPHVAIYDSTTGTELKRIKLGEGGVVSYALDWSPDGKKIAAALDGSVVILDSERGNFLVTLSEGHAGIAYYLAWSPDGGKIASTFVSQNTAIPNSLNIWDADLGNSIRKVATENDIWVRGVEWSPDSSKLAAGWGDGTVRIFHGTDYTETKIFTSGFSLIDDVSWSRDGSKLASSNGRVKVWDYSTGSLLGSSENFQWLGDLEVSPDDTKIASIGDDEILHIWDFASLIGGETTTTTAMSAITTTTTTTTTTQLPAVSEEAKKFIPNPEKCKPIVFNGDPKDKLDVVFVPVNYGENLIPFLEFVDKTVQEGFHKIEPFSNEKEKINFYFVDSRIGVKQMEVIETKNYFRKNIENVISTYCPTDELIYIFKENLSAAFAAGAAFTGPGIVSVLHEFGHSFGGLADEYFLESQPWEIWDDLPNLDIVNTSVACPKWCSGPSKISKNNFCSLTVDKEDCLKKSLSYPIDETVPFFCNWRENTPYGTRCFPFLTAKVSGPNLYVGLIEAIDVGTNCIEAVRCSVARANAAAPCQDCIMGYKRKFEYGKIASEELKKRLYFYTKR